MREFPKRVLVAVVLIPIVLGCVWTGGPPLVTLLSLAAGLAAWEFYRLAAARGASAAGAAGPDEGSAALRVVEAAKRSARAGRTQILR